ncbi:MAG: hypothetical protein DCF19_01835 [Pseudanabaena frigida]|uniref:Uncharacterized protein n=1 Tax=Pseudanabaena frigida TaxID=945775 RepID=A0A2W4WHC0_9CYAN|nr:MAG: hypothetical protein DCF19_01835 [Pseudanabaena frigida]
MVVMPRFQSRLFNWIDRSLPVQLGRRARRSLDRQLKQLPSIRELPRLLAYQVAKAALYPVYLIASTAQRTFPTLARGKEETLEKVRSQPDSGGLLPESDKIAENLENPIEQTLDLPNPEIPLLLRPLAKFLNWLDRTKIQLDRNIAAIIKRQPDNLTTLDYAELDSNLIANRIFARIWQQQVEQSNAEQNALKESNSLSENVALGKNTRLEQLKRLIEAAIAYFFGNQSETQDETLISDEEASEILSTESLERETLSDSPKMRRRRVNSASSGDRLLTDRQRANLQKNKSQSPTVRTSGELKDNAPLTQSTNLDRLRELIAAAIDYFIGKRSLDGDGQANINTGGSQSDFLEGEPSDKLQANSERSPNRDSNSTTESSNSLKNDDRLERLQRLIEEAIAYFFGRQLSQPALDETSEISSSGESWLTMEDVFGNDNGPWPLPLEYESQAFTKSPDKDAIHSSGELQNFETTTTQISQERLDGSLIFEEELLMYQQQNAESESDRPLRAWIEAKASIMGYAYNPVMTVILWIDEIVLKIENLIITLWKGLINCPKRLIHFIRYGKRR